MIEARSVYQSIDTEAYIKACFPLTDEERAIRDQILDLVPEVIIDIHSHAGLSAHAINMHSRFFNDLISTFPYFTMTQHKDADDILWGNKKVRHAIFAFPFEGVDIGSANQYINASDNQLAIPFVAADSNQLDLLKRELYSGKWKGVKAYYRQHSPDSRIITDFYPPAIMEVIDTQGLPLVLHLPNDLQNDGDELISLLEIYKNAKFVIAHMGFPDLEGTEKYTHILERLKSYNNIFFETSWSFSADAIRSVIEILGPDKLLYGSDQPLNLIRAIVVKHPTLGERVAVGIPYHWADPNEQQYYRDYLGIDITNIPIIHFQSIKAVLAAISGQSADKSQRAELARKIFYNNSSVLLKSS